MLVHAVGSFGAVQEIDDARGVTPFCFVGANIVAELLCGGFAVGHLVRAEVGVYAQARIYLKKTDAAYSETTSHVADEEVLSLGIPASMDAVLVKPPVFLVQSQPVALEGVAGRAVLA